MIKSTANTNFRNAAVCIPQFMGCLLEPVKGQIFHRRLTCYLLKAPETFCPADIYFPCDIFYSNGIGISAFHVFQYLFHPFLLLCVSRFFYINTIFRSLSFCQQCPGIAQLISHLHFPCPSILFTIIIYPL